MLALIAQADLPTADLDDSSRARFLVATDGDAVVGCVGVERYGDAGLLRSLAVARGARGSGLGGQLAEAALEAARAEGLTEVALLTTTAAPFFQARGWRVVERWEVPEAVRQSGQFGGSCAACPASATCMTRAIDAADLGRSTTTSGTTAGASGGSAA